MKRVLFFGIAALCGLLMMSSQAEEKTGRAAGLFRCQLHRGAGNAMPDNSMEAFLYAWGHGVTPEADARLTKDGVAIAFHDGDLKRIPYGIPDEWKKRKIKDMTWNELKDLDMGSTFDPKFSHVRLATMDAVFAAMKGRPERLLYLDEKGAPPEMMAKMSEEYGVQDQVIYTSSKYELLPRWKKIAPKGKTMLWMGSWSKTNTLEEVKRTEEFLQKKLDVLVANKFDGVDQVQIHVRTDFSKPDPFCPSSAFLKKAADLFHKNGVLYQNITWTEMNNPKVYKLLWDLGADSFATDGPAALFQAMPELK
ncbi:MAG: hypothetical protein IJR99_09975 [Kiritimatiellae bacterium]|nr:hypothetical protein [Kiritimatiellia bacterium]